MVKTIGKVKLSPNVLIGELLATRCHNCGLPDINLLFSGCSRCGYPSPPRLECMDCGLKMTRARHAKCPRCGGKTAEIVNKNPVASPVPAAPEPAPAPVAPVEELPPPLPPIAEPVISPAPEPADSVPEPVVVENPPEAVKETPPPAEILPPQKIEIPVLTEDFSVSIEQLAVVFAGDAGGADQQYKDKVIRIKGSVVAVSAEGTENPYIILGSPEERIALKVKCYFDSRYRHVVPRIVPGRRVTVLGKYGGSEPEIHLMECMPAG